MRKINLADFLLQTPITYNGSTGKGISKRKVYGLDRKWHLTADAGCVVFKNVKLFYTDGKFQFKNDIGDTYIIMLDTIDKIYELKNREVVPINDGKTTISGDYDYLIKTKDGKDILISRK